MVKFKEKFSRLQENVTTEGILVRLKSPFLYRRGIKIEYIYFIDILYIIILPDKTEPCLFFHLVVYRRGNFQELLVSSCHGVGDCDGDLKEMFRWVSDQVGKDYTLYIHFYV